jgi:hypothetical protein
LQIARGKSHPFLQIPILNDSKLLGELEKLVTLEPAGAVKSATGVPATVAIREEVREAVKMLHEYREGEYGYDDEDCNRREVHRKWEHHSNICARANC